MPKTATAGALVGGCHCGAVRYRAAPPPASETLCHCSACRRTTGAPLVAWFTVERDRFRFTQGRPVRYASSSRAERTFCGRCGTQLTFEHADFPREIDVTICSLDDPGALPPKDHTRASSRLPWIVLDDGLPQYAEAREDG